MDRIKAWLSKYWLTFCICTALVALYVYATETGRANPYLFPRLDAIEKVLHENKSLMFVNLMASMKLMIPSVLISLGIALFVGLLLGMNERLRDALYPIIYMFSVIPSILLSPFALLLAPNFWCASVFLIVYGTVWSTLFAAITGIMTIDKRYLDKAAALELRGVKRLVKVILPAASPSILSGFVDSLRGTFVMLVYSEMYGAQYGMGFFVKKYAEFGLYDYTWGGFLFMVAVLIVVMQFFEQIKKHMLKWTTHGQAR